MTEQKIVTPGFNIADTTKVIPITSPVGVYTALRYIYSDDKVIRDVNDWYVRQKNKKKRKRKHKDKNKASFEDIHGWNDVPSFNPWQTATNVRNGIE